jgi:hypothetical protein
MLKNYNPKLTMGIINCLIFYIVFKFLFLLSQTTKGENKRKTNVKDSLICFPSDEVGALRKKNVKFCSIFAG